MTDHYRAWTWRGGADPLALELEQRPMPTPAPGQVLVRNRVIGLNPVDWKVLGGDLMAWSAGKIPGVDGTGDVIAVGEDVDASWQGQRVAYHQDLMQPGSFAEITPVAARALMRVPDTLDDDIAASFPCPALTAWQALAKVPLIAGQTLLVSGAGGAVGHYLVQLAATRGIDITVMCHPRHWDRLRAFGARHGVAGPLPEAATWPAGDARFHAVIDSVNAEHARRLTPALRANGHIVCIQGRLPAWPCEPFGRALSMHEVALGALHHHGNDQDWAELTAAGERMLQYIADGRLEAQPRVARDFRQLPSLLDELRQRRFSGKPVVRV